MVRESDSSDYGLTDGEYNLSEQFWSFIIILDILIVKLRKGQVSYYTISYICFMMLLLLRN